MSCVSVFLNFSSSNLKPQKTVVNARKFDGQIHRSWNCDLISQSGELLTLIGVFDAEVNHPDLGVIRRGTISYEFYWLRRYYNIFRFHEPEGGLKMFYCNVNLPPKFENGVLDYVDLDLDILVDKNFKYRVLDADEFAVNSVKYQYPPEIVRKVGETRTEIIRLIESRLFPFDYLEK